MPLKFIRAFQKTIGFRLTFWYAGIFVLSFLTLSILSYLFVFSSMRDHRGVIQSQLRQYASLIETGGVEALAGEIGRHRSPSRRNSFFVRVASAENATIYLANPKLWKEFDLVHGGNPALPGQWQYYASLRDGDLLEVASARLANRGVLQVGKSIQDREEVLERFRDTLLATVIPMVLISVAGGVFLAHRAMQPVRNLTSVTRAIVDTSQFKARVPNTQTGDELNDLVVLFNQMLERIESLIRGMKDALDNVAHDLRTPVTRLRVTAEGALQSGADREACRDALADCLEESERVTTMLTMLMDISEAETGTMKLALENVSIAELVNDVWDLYSHVAEEKKVSLVKRASAHLFLRADHSRMRQVLANLVDNGIKYTPAGGRVEIEAFQRGPEMMILVRDTGIGIPQEEIPRIWERLYRGDRSRSQRGLGLGLSFVKAVVEAHRGRVEACENPAGGTLIAMYFPDACLT